MLSDDAEARLRALLIDAGVDLAAPGAGDVERTWAVMRAFAAEPVEDADLHEGGDAILAQFGTYDWGQGPSFQVGLTRQFEFDDEDGNHDHFSQLQCTYYYAPTDALRDVGAGELWSFDLPLDDFFAQALALPGFRAVAAAPAPQRLEIFYEEV